MTELNQNMPISSADLPRYEDMWQLFETVQKDPDSKPLSMLQKLKMLAQNIGDRFWGISGPSEYDTGRKYIPTFHGEKYRTTHVKDGQVLSETITGIYSRRDGDKILKNEIKSTTPLVPNGLHRVLSRRTSLSLDGEKDKVLTEGVTLPNGVSYARTQNFETGETVFRKNEKGIFEEWTFDSKKRLISAYEGRFGEDDLPDTMRQTEYRYDPKGHLISATETQNTITPDGEKTEVVHHPVGVAPKRLGGRE